MSVTMGSLLKIENAHHSGDPYWDGDQTLWEGRVSEGGESETLLFVVARGDGYIEEAKVRAEIARFTLSELREKAADTPPGRRATVRLSIAPE